MVRSLSPHCSAAILTEKLNAILRSPLDFKHRRAQTCIDMKVQHRINTKQNYELVQIHTRGV
jgi:hypothetical protein